MLQGPTPREGPGNSIRSVAPENFSFILGSDAEKAFGISLRSPKQIRTEASFANIRIAYNNLDPYAESYIKTKMTFPMVLALPYLIEGQPDHNDLQKVRLIVDSCRHNVIAGFQSNERGKKGDMVMSVVPLILICKALASCREDQQELQTALKENIDRTLKFVHNFTCLIVDKFTGNSRSIRDWIGEILKEYLTLEHSAAEASCCRDLIETISDQRTYDTIVHGAENSPTAIGEREDSLAFSALSDQFFAEWHEREDRNLVQFS